MNEIDWNKILEFTVPIIIAIIGALVAIYNVRQNIKLNHKLKKKDELREIFIDLVMSIKKLKETVEIAFNGNNSDERLRSSQLSQEINDEIMSKVLLLGLYYDENDKVFEDTGVLFLNEIKKIRTNTNAKSDDSEINLTVLIKGFKKLYDGIKI